MKRHQARAESKLFVEIPISLIKYRDITSNTNAWDIYTHCEQYPYNEIKSHNMQHKKKIERSRKVVLTSGRDPGWAAPARSWVPATWAGASRGWPVSGRPRSSSDGGRGRLRGPLGRSSGAPGCSDRRFVREGWWLMRWRSLFLRMICVVWENGVCVCVTLSDPNVYFFQMFNYIYNCEGMKPMSTCVFKQRVKYGYGKLIQAQFGCQKVLWSTVHSQKQFHFFNSQNCSLFDKYPDFCTSEGKKYPSIESSV